MTETVPGTQCPMEHFELTVPSAPALSQYQALDALQDRVGPMLRNTEADGYWMFTDHDIILDGLQHPELWSSSVIVPTEPDPPYKWIPVMIDPPDHAKWRQVLAEYFSPGRVKGMLDGQRQLARELVESIAAQGECDFVTQVARVFPSTVFVGIMGMPVEKLDDFLRWEDQILHAEGEGDELMANRLAGMGEVIMYFTDLIAQRRADLDPEADDIVSKAIAWTIEGEPVNDGDLMNCLLLLFMAGLDTVASQLSYIMLHLGSHSDDRARLASEPSLIPRAIEEMMRVYPIIQTARKATQDMDFHGCPVKAGDMAAFPLAMAGRDNNEYEDARRVDLDRGIIRHLSFGGGPHRCLGSHLARQEMQVLLEEWHNAIPVYEVVGDPVEHSGQVFGLDSLGLKWSKT